MSVIDILSGHVCHTLKGAHKNIIQSISAACDKLFASSGEDGIVKIWDLRESDSQPVKVSVTWEEFHVRKCVYILFNGKKYFSCNKILRSSIHLTMKWRKNRNQSVLCQLYPIVAPGSQLEVVKNLEYGTLVPESLLRFLTLKEKILYYLRIFFSNQTVWFRPQHNHAVVNF